LQRWTGRSGDELSDPVLAAAPPVADFVARHPGFIVKQRDIEVARRDVELARLNRQPNWTYEVSYGQRQGRANLMSFGVSIPLPIAAASRQDRDTAARLALVDKAEAELEEAGRAAALEYAVLTSDAHRLRERIERYESGVLVPLAQRTASVLSAYRSNQASLAMVFEARHAELEAQRKLLGLHRELSKVQVQLSVKPVTPGAAP
jgi:outer membrane protein TolC